MLSYTASLSIKQNGFFSYSICAMEEKQEGIFDWEIHHKVSHLPCYGLCHSFVYSLSFEVQNFNIPLLALGLS